MQEGLKLPGDPEEAVAMGAVGEDEIPLHINGLNAAAAGASRGAE